MSRTRVADAGDLARLWPAVRGAHLFGSFEEFQAFASTGPWRVRLGDQGDGLVLARWREHLDLLAIRSLWASDPRIAALVEDAAAVARSQGFGRVLSPLLTTDRLGPYRSAGMEVFEHLAAFQCHPDDIAAYPAPAGTSIRTASHSDVAAIEVVDEASFEGLWRYGPAEIETALAAERVSVAVDEAGDVVGYATVSVRGTAGTLGRLGVDPAERGRGIGRALLAESAAWAHGTGAFSLSLCTHESNAAARSLYRKAGMTELVDRYALLVRDA